MAFSLASQPTSDTYMTFPKMFQVRDQLLRPALQRVAVELVTEQGDGIPPHMRSDRFAQAYVTSVGGRFGGEGV